MELDCDLAVIENKKYIFYLFSLRVLIQKIKYLGQVVMVLGQVQTDRQTHRQTDTQTYPEWTKD